MINLLFHTARPPEAPLKVCPDFRGFVAPKIALSLSGDRGFEAEGCPGLEDLRPLGRKFLDFHSPVRPNLALQTTACKCEGFSTP